MTPRPDYSGIWDQVKAEFNCDHPDRTYRRLVASNGVTHYRTQCQRCGNTNAVKRSEVAAYVANVNGIPEVDETIGEQWRQRRQQRREELVRQTDHAHTRQLEAESAEWWHAYRTYLASPEWAARRDLVLRRADGICEGCLDDVATQVHHLTYEHVTDELCWELRAVCDACHQKCHPHKSLGGGTALQL